MEAACPEGNEGPRPEPGRRPSVARRIGLAEDPEPRAGSAAIPDHQSEAALCFGRRVRQEGTTEVTAMRWARGMLRLRIVASIVWAGVVAVQEITLSPFSEPVPKRERRRPEPRARFSDFQ
jgi:hypothetical protein